MKLSPEQARIIEGIITKIRPQFLEDVTGHDWHHIERVAKMAEHIQSVEGGNLFVVKAAAYLHDVSDHKLNGGKLNEGGNVSRTILKELLCPTDDIEAIVQIVDGVSFKGANVKDSMASIEGQIVQDADRLDAIGAMGIARTFAYGSNRNRPIYDPSVPFKLHNSFEEYAKSGTHTINHFYEKLLLLRNRLNTAEGKRVGDHRHKFMVQYLKEFYSEWDITGEHKAPVELEQADN